MIEGEQYRPAIKLLAFSLKPPMKFQEMRSRLICTINLAQAYRWSGDDKRCREIISSEDWSATSPDFSLSVVVLTENYKEAAKIMKQIGSSSDEVRKQDYDSWPVFKEFRKTTAFVDAYREIFGTEMELKSVPPELKTLLSQAAPSSKQAP
jgi:ABC-type glycerol-3-phosphate transport system substrate-binding protein